MNRALITVTFKLHSIASTPARATRVDASTPPSRRPSRLRARRRDGAIARALEPRARRRGRDDRDAASRGGGGGGGAGGAPPPRGGGGGARARGVDGGALARAKARRRGRDAARRRDAELGARDGEDRRDVVVGAGRHARATRGRALRATDDARGFTIATLVFKRPVYRAPCCVIIHRTVYAYDA